MKTPFIILLLIVTTIIVTMPYLPKSFAGTVLSNTTKHAATQSIQLSVNVTLGDLITVEYVGVNVGSTPSIGDSDINSYTIALFDSVLGAGSGTDCYNAAAQNCAVGVFYAVAKQTQAGLTITYTQSAGSPGQQELSAQVTEGYQDTSVTKQMTFVDVLGNSSSIHGFTGCYSATALGSNNALNVGSCYQQLSGGRVQSVLAGYSYNQFSDNSTISFAQEYNPSDSGDTGNISYFAPRTGTTMLFAFVSFPALPGPTTTLVVYKTNPPPYFSLQNWFMTLVVMLGFAGVFLGGYTKVENLNSSEQILTAATQPMDSNTFIPTFLVALFIGGLIALLLNITSWITPTIVMIALMVVLWRRRG